VPATFLGLVQRLRVFRVGSAERARERIFMFRYRYQVNMVGHQAVTGDLCAVTVSVSGQQSQVETAILCGVKYLLAIVAALGDVMGDAWSDHARTSRHETEVVGGGMESHGKCVCPLFVQGKRSEARRGRIFRLPSARHGNGVCPR
jgi:hypothetical protein